MREENKIIPTLTRNNIKNFQHKVFKKKGCWPWQAYCHEQGYGLIKINGSLYKAHRIAYYLFHNIDPLKLNVLHSCDNPRCCNPTHLFLGTQDDNNQDKMNKGRFIPNFGENNGMSKVTKEIVNQMRFKKALGATIDELAKEFNVDRTTCAKICRYQTWK